MKLWATLRAKGDPVWQEFKKFVMRGNVIDLAVGIIIGGAFREVVNSLVNDILMPPIGLLLARVDFNNLFIPLSGGRYTTLAEAQQAGAATINYGRFINSIIDFLIIGVVIFFLVRWVNRLAREKPAPPSAPTTKACPFCYTMIPIQASRCPNCTSLLPQGQEEGAGR
ncbi:MAG: large conductance mechanosensitive channel protein MscL [Chloroflexi bacterium]|nr:large conductance mechanosensitive channel protein MscL [Chloroflexota bacterium]